MEKREVSYTKAPNSGQREQKPSLREQMRRQRDRRPTGAAKLVGREHRKEKRSEGDQGWNSGGAETSNDVPVTRAMKQTPGASVKAARFGALSFGARKEHAVAAKAPALENERGGLDRECFSEAREGVQSEPHPNIPAFDGGSQRRVGASGSHLLGHEPQGRSASGEGAPILEEHFELRKSGIKRRNNEESEEERPVRVKREPPSPLPEPARSQGPRRRSLDLHVSSPGLKASQQPRKANTGASDYSERLEEPLLVPAAGSTRSSESNEADEAADLEDLRLAVELGIAGPGNFVKMEFDGLKTGEEEPSSLSGRNASAVAQHPTGVDSDDARPFIAGVRSDQSAEIQQVKTEPRLFGRNPQADAAGEGCPVAPVAETPEVIYAGKPEPGGSDDTEVGESTSESVSDWGSSGGSEGEGAARALADLRLATELGLFKEGRPREYGTATQVKTEAKTEPEMGVEIKGGEDESPERGGTGAVAEEPGSGPGVGKHLVSGLRRVKEEPGEELRPGECFFGSLHERDSEQGAARVEQGGSPPVGETWQNEDTGTDEMEAPPGRPVESEEAPANDELPAGTTFVGETKQSPTSVERHTPSPATINSVGPPPAERDRSQPQNPSQSQETGAKPDRSKDIRTTPPSPLRSSGGSVHLGQPSPASPANRNPQQPANLSPAVDKVPELAITVRVKDAAAGVDGNRGGDTFVWRYAKAAPSAAQLRDTWQQHGLQEHDYGGAFYGNPKDVPERLAVFAGLEFNVRSRAVIDLPPVPFNRASACPASRALVLPGNLPVPPGGYVSAPVRRPPSRAAVERWLARRQRREERKKRRAARAAGGPAAFKMNPNTGALIPMVTQKGGDTSQASGATDEGLEGQPDPSPQSETSGSSSGSEAEEGGTETEEVVRPASPKYDEAQGLGTPLFAVGPSQRRRTSTASWRQSQRRAAPGESLEEPLRPTSPKYDEAHGLSLPYLTHRGAQKRTSFQSNPIAVTQPAELYRGTSLGVTSPLLQSPSFRSRPPLSPAHQGNQSSQFGGVTKPSSQTPQSKTPLPLQFSQKPGESPAVTTLSNPPKFVSPGLSQRTPASVPVVSSPQGQAEAPVIGAVNRTPPAAKLHDKTRPEGSVAQLASGVESPVGAHPPFESPFKVPPPPVRAPPSNPSPQVQTPRPSSTTLNSTPPEPPPDHVQHDDVTNVGPVATSAGGALTPGSSPGQTLTSLGPTVPSPKRDRSQITPPSPVGGGTPVSQVGFRDPAIAGGGQQLTLMSIEMHAASRGDLRPDPRYDAVGCVVVSIMEDGASAAEDAARGDPSGELREHVLVLMVDEQLAQDRQHRNLDGIPGCEVVYLPTELALLHAFVAAVRAYDPDMLVGWEVQNASVGYLAERAAHLGFGLLKALSRTPPGSAPDGTEQAPPSGAAEVAGGGWAALGRMEAASALEAEKGIIEDEWGRTHASGIHVVGRVVLNLWRLMRGEVKLNIYSLESVADAVLRRKIPSFPWRTLSGWFARGVAGGRWRCVQHIVERARLNFDILDQLDFVNRTSELARVFGIDFFSVLNRGSQYRVESMLLRLARSQNYIAISPSRRHVAEQPAMEALPLVMEPESRFYTDPVLVLDFQSLYPSMIIAYNLCFSTCLGRIARGNPRVLGITQLHLAPGTLPALKDDLILTPNAIMYAPPQLRPGVLPRLLNEILTTRIMVKAAMKRAGPAQRVLARIQNARQFALKLIANVTYGYTAAGFSGRMPCAELADSIVQCGRYTLERAIQMVESNPKWGARVVYGDTDSMFVHLKGRSRADAHRIGAEIAAAVTAANPPPVKLQMEKVYQPCMLVTKKRYVGYMYESPDQKTPTFDAKGIETVRRDSCPAVAKTMERCLRVLFESKDLSAVKRYLQRQLEKILAGRVSVHDFVFAKEVRLGTYSPNAAVLPPAAIVASKAMAKDPRAEPKYAERIRYVVVHGEPGARLVDMVVDPAELLVRWGALRLHGPYYITKQILPAIQRLLGLVGADVRAWYAEMPKVYRPPPSKRPTRTPPTARWGDFGHVPGQLANGAENGNHEENENEGAEWALIGAANAVDLIAGGGRGRASRRGAGGTIDQYYLSRHCAVCSRLTRAAETVCKECAAAPQMVGMALTGRAARLEREYAHLVAICDTCGGADGSHSGKIACTSLDCGVYYERAKVEMELLASAALASQYGTYSGINRFIY